MNPTEVGRKTRELLEHRHVGLGGILAVPEFLPRIERFAATLALWGSRTNLTAHPDDPSELAFHIMDSLAPLTVAIHHEGALLGDYFRRGRRVLDLGSGAGFPGLVLAAASAAEFTLVEARHKRTSFLRIAAAEMGLDTVAVEARSESVSRETIFHRSDATPSVVGLSPARPFDTVLGRAFAKPEIFCRKAATLLRDGGCGILYANREQSIENAIEGAGLVPGPRIPYEVWRGDHQVERVLALFHR
jgi:16S rRNA (guanine527-N7)-methyltransferase